MTADNSLDPRSRRDEPDAAAQHPSDAAEQPTGAGRNRDPEKVAANAKRYREAHQEQRRAYAQRYRAENAEKIAAYRREYRQGPNRERALELRRAEVARARKRERQREKERARRRELYAQNRDRIRAQKVESTRRYNERKRAEDPEGFLAHKAKLAREWRARNKDKIARQDHERYVTNREQRRAATKAWRDANPERVKESQRRYYEKNREKSRERSKQWRAREKRRREAGLPPRRRHTVTPAERAQNAAAAEAFFDPTAWTNERIAAMREENRVASEEHARFRRASQRARAIAYAVEHPEAIAKLSNVDKPRAARLARERAEADRMDAIAKQINDRLRGTPRRTPPAPLPNPAAAHKQGPQR